MTSTLELAIAKISQLPEEAQDQIGLELLDRMAALERLRAELDIGIREADAGLAKPLDFDVLIKRLHEEHARRR